MQEDPAKSIEFIELVREKPWLYDYSRPDYRNRSKIDKTWLEIANKTNETVAVCKDKWKNIRGRYVKQMANNNSSSGEGKPRGPYYLAEHLYFLDPFIRRGKCRGGYIKPESPGLSDGVEECHFGDFPLSVSFTEDPIDESDNSNLSTLEASRKRTADSDANGEPLQYLEERKRLRFQDSGEDPDVSFLYSILPDMKRMNEYQKRNFKVGILNLAGQILEQPVIVPPLPNIGSQFSPQSSDAQIDNQNQYIV